jgi:hypothetical protein
MHGSRASFKTPAEMRAWYAEWLVDAALGRTWPSVRMGLASGPMGAPSRRRRGPRGVATALRGGIGGRRSAVNILWDDLSVRDATARLWPQTEYLKASVALGVEEEALVAGQGLRTYLDAPCRGAWRDAQGADGGFAVTPSPASSFYHIAGACFRLLRP